MYIFFLMHGQLSCRNVGALLIAALVVLIGIAGCGSSGPGKPATPSASTPTDSAQQPATNPPPLTKGEFIARSNAFCANSWQDMRKRYAAYRRAQNNSGKSNAQLFSRATGDIFLPALLFWYDDINSLDRPNGDSAQIETLLTKGLQAAVVAGLKRPYSFRSPSELAALYRRSNRLVRAYGINSCVVTNRTLSFAG